VNEGQEKGRSPYTHREGNEPGSLLVRFLFGDGGHSLEELGEELRGEVP
jgi:hypothetical protein